MVNGGTSQMQIQVNGRSYRPDVLVVSFCAGFLKEQEQLVHQSSQEDGEVWPLAVDGLEVPPRRGEPGAVPGVLVLEGGAELAGAVVVTVVLEADVLARLDEEGGARRPPRRQLHRHRAARRVVPEIFNLLSMEIGMLDFSTETK